MDKELISKVQELYNKDSKSFTCKQCKTELDEHDCNGCPIYAWGHSGD